MGTALFLVRYGEIGIKSPPVRRRFERLLADNIALALRARGAEGRVEHPWGRLFVEAPEAAGRDALAHTFGVVSFSPALRTSSELSGLAEVVAREASRIPDGATFAVRPRRSGEPGYTSNDAARALGAAILEQHRARGLSVDLDEPDAEVFVEVRGPEAFIAFERVPGPGGLPLGSEGRVAAWVAEPRDALAAWLVMKRGCRVDLLAPRGLGEALAKALAPWAPGLELTEVDAGPEERALVLALLEARARRRGGGAVVVGDRFLDAMALAPLDRTIAMPVFRPLLALEPAMVQQLAARVGVSLAEGEARALPRLAPAEGEARARAEALLAGAATRKVEL
ncbi:MAG TPA: THUMP domain-containing protein [Candidatus Thermoplasmatota archaeon]|jgi:thiamine biosynthesis protein ThiI|nr:THUMP domain-containing protein [Candidatus Thermoplasmatota archaeon]